MFLNLEIYNLIMTKPIIATCLVGIFLSAEPWGRAHILWFEDASKELERDEVEDWGKIYIEPKLYFQKIDEIMKILYPAFSDEQ